MGDQPTMPQPPDGVSQDHWDPPAYIRAAHEAKPQWAMTSRQRMTYGIIGTAVLGAIIVACIIAGVSGAGATSTTTQNRTPIPTNTPKPTATPNPNAGLAAYIAVAQPDSHTVGSDLETVGTACGASDLNSCYSDLQTLSDDVHRFQKDLDAHPAPPCLKNADSDLRSALQLIDSGAQSAMDGIKQNDVTLVDKASSYFTQGTRYIHNATDGLKTANC